MATEVQFRRGTTAQHSTFTGAAGEMTIDTTKNTVVVHDGSTAGGFPAAKESDITSLQTQLNAKAPIDSPTFTTTLDVERSGPAQVRVNDTGGVSYPGIVFQQNGTRRFLVEQDNSNNQAYIFSYDADGTTPRARIIFEADGDLNLIPKTGQEVKVNGQAIAGGTSAAFTPTIVSNSNVSTIAGPSGIYMRVGNVVTVNGRCAVTTPAIGLASFNITLPIASNLTVAGDLAGVINSAVPATDRGGTVSGSTSLDQAVCTFYSGSSATRNVFFSFMYVVK